MVLTHAISITVHCQVILEWDYVMLCVRLKLLDVTLGFWVWAGIGWSWLGSQPYRYTPI
jgi:hypothetical protein